MKRRITISFDVGILINKEKKKKRINLVEVNLSNGYKRTIGHYKTAGDALVALEKRQKELIDDPFCPVSYEAIFVKGFK